MSEGYRFNNAQSLERMTQNITRHTLEEFYPSWYTEHWVNMSTGNNERITFRFERPSYIGTLIGSVRESHYFGSSHVAESSALSNVLAKQHPNLYRKDDSNSDSIRNIVKKLLRSKRITDLSFVLGDQEHADYVRVVVDDGSYGIVAFKPGTLIAIEHNSGSSKHVFGVEGKDVGHRRLNLALSVASGKDVIYTEPVDAPVYKLPDFT
jgi:hypothetical protein